jgi:hypothetical protein
MTASDHLSQQFYHLTNDPKFHLDPEKVPQDNSITLSRILGPERKGLYVTKSPERWVNGYDYVRPYVAEIHAHPKHVEGGEYGGEGFIPSEHFGQTKVHRVIPLDAHAREEYGEHGWIESHHETTFDTGEKIVHPGFNDPISWPHKGYKYSGPDVRTMPKRETERHRKRVNKYLMENRGFDREDLP